MQQSGRCIFCGGVGLTKEHVFARWLHPYLPISDRLNHEAFFELVLPDGSRTDIRKRSGDPHSGKLRVVCRTCNNGWMSQLQAQAKPILTPLLEGKDSLLWRRQANVLASWITMFVIVTEWHRRDPDLVVSGLAERLAFAKSQRPPAGWRIWIGRHDRKEWPGVFSRTTFPILEDGMAIGYASSGAARPNSQAVTFVLASVVVHVVSSPIKEFLQKQKLPPQALAPLWPVRGTPVRWPLAYELTDTDLDNLADGVHQRLKSVVGVPFAFG